MANTSKAGTKRAGEQGSPSKSGSATKSSAASKVDAGASSTKKASAAKAAAPRSASPAKKAAPAKKATPVKATKAVSTKKAASSDTAAVATASVSKETTASSKKAAQATTEAKVNKVMAVPKEDAPAPVQAESGAPVVRTPAQDKFIEEQRKLLLEERASHALQASLLRAEAEQLAADREPGDVQFDEESGEGDTMNVERERDLVLSAQALSAVDEIDRALEKMDLGTYGICERCQEPIPKERLRALPYAALCVRCKSGGIGRPRG